MYAWLVTVLFLRACTRDIFVVAIPQAWNALSATPHPTTVESRLGPNRVAVTTSAPPIRPSHPDLLKREVGNDFCGWEFGISSAYYKCDGSPGTCLYDPTRSVVGCDIGFDILPTTCLDYTTPCDNDCLDGELQKGIVSCPSASHCIIATFPSGYRGYQCAPSGEFESVSLLVSWSYTGMDTVIHLPRWLGADGSLSYGTVVPSGVATPTGTFTGGHSLDVTCCGSQSPSASTSSPPLSGADFSSQTVPTAGVGTTLSTKQEVPGSSASGSASVPLPATSGGSSSGGSSSGNSGLSNDSIIGIAVGVPACVVGIIGVGVAIYFGKKSQR